MNITDYLGVNVIPWRVSGSLIVDAEGTPILSLVAQTGEAHSERRNAANLSLVAGAPLLFRELLHLQMDPRLDRRLAQRIASALDQIMRGEVPD